MSARLVGRQMWGREPSGSSAWRSMLKRGLCLQQRSLSDMNKGIRFDTCVGKPVERRRYPDHIPTSLPQKLLLSVGSAFAVFVDPTRTNMLAMLGEVSGLEALKKIHMEMCSHPIGTRILATRPLIRTNTSINLEALGNLPKDTFGYAYAQFMSAHTFNPDHRAIVKYVDDEELAYVMQRFRELHDFWHVLFDLPPTEFGEIILKYVELTQTQLPVCALSALVGPFRLTSTQRGQLFRYYIPWARRIEKSCPSLMNVYYEEEFETSLKELRRRLNIETAPKIL